MVEIIISSKSIYQNNNNYSINFDYINKNSVLLELSIIGVSKKSFVYWEIFSNGSQVDLNDLTTGHKVELKILKSYSGPKSNPHIFTIIAKNKERQEIARKDIEVFASPKVEKAYWSNWHSEIEKAFINSDIYVHIEGKGLYKKPLTLKIFTEKEQEIITREIQIDNLTEDIIVSLDYSYGLGFFSSFFGKILLLPIDKIFFVLEDREGNILYRSNYLRIIKNFFTRKSEEKSITPVVIYDEEYFTQRYEPCKYESISYAYGKEGDTLFNHGEPTKKKKNNYNINIITGNDPKGQKLEITLGGVDTRECEYNDKNRIYTAYSSIDNKEFKEQKYKDHKGNIFDKQVLLDNGIINEENKENILKFVPKYPYPKDDWEFLKQSLFGEAISKTIAINTCRYKKKIALKVFPDIVLIGNFSYNYNKSYFYREKNLRLEQGLDKVINEYINSPFFYLFTIFPKTWLEQYLILEYIKYQAKDYKYNIHLIYNRKGEKTEESIDLQGESIDITQQTKYGSYILALPILQLVMLGIFIDLLMIYLTRGRNLTGKVKRISQKLKKINTKIDELNDKGIEIFPPSIAINAGTFYQKQKGRNIAKVYEMNIKCDPLVAVEFSKEFDLLDMITKQDDIKGAKTPNTPEVLQKLNKNKKGKDILLRDFNNNKVKGTIKVKGEIIFEHNVKFEILQGNTNIIEIIGDGVATAKDERLLTQQITMNTFVDVQFRKDFRFDPLQTKVEAKAKTELKGALAVKVKYGVNEKEGLFVEKKLIFSGIEGSFLGKIKKTTKFLGKIISDTEYETNNGKPISFTLIEPFEITLYKVQLFNNK